MFLGSEFSLNFTKQSLQMPQVTKSFPSTEIENLTVSFWYRFKENPQNSIFPFVVTLYPVSEDALCNDLSMVIDEDGDLWIRFGSYSSYPVSWINVYC